VDTVLFVIHAEAQHLRFAEIEVVLPAQAVTTGVEARIEGAVLKSVIQVLAVSRLQGDVPEGQRREARTTADRLQGAVAVGIVATGTVGRTGVEIAVVLALQPTSVELQAIVEAIAGTQLRGQFPVAVGIRLVCIRVAASIGASIDTVSGFAGHTEIEPAVAVTAGHTGRPAVARTRTGTHREVRLEALGAATAGEYLDHSAHGFRAVQAGARSTDDLDALDLFEWNVLQRGAAGGCRADPNAIDQHQYVLFATAANGHRGFLAAPPVAGDADSSQALQQLRHAAGLLAFDFVTGDETAGSNGYWRVAGSAGGAPLVVQLPRVAMRGPSIGGKAQQHRSQRKGIAHWIEVLRRAHPHDQNVGGDRRKNLKEGSTAKVRTRSAPAALSVKCDRPVSGLASGCVIASRNHAFPCVEHSGRCGFSTRLPLRGQRRNLRENGPASLFHPCGFLPRAPEATRRLVQGLTQCNQDLE